MIPQVSGRDVMEGWQRMLKEYLQAQVTVLAGSLARLHPAEDRVWLEAGLFWMHEKISS